ncbi:MAG: bifunctional 2-polyprenyl-6-hydroxyphenol methylase/3-demethylubiquinol 3-O-methyltransferase UbiG [Syntrophotaleaceae bacterium]
MKTTAAAIDNDIYDQYPERWWSATGFASLLEHVSNPWRFPYFQRILHHEGRKGFCGKRLLDVGCGGGVLTEEFAAIGLTVTGLDPSEKSIQAARAHARENGLAIEYRHGSGDRLPFDTGSFDLVSCCDVLEHIQNWDHVVAEVARVLKPGGLFFYDTINRTPISKLVFIKLAQEWKYTRFLPPNLHVWDMFIRPEELTSAMNRHGLLNMDIRGTNPPKNPFRMLWAMRGLNRGRISAAEFGRRVGGSVEGPDINVNYMGYAIRKSNG